MARCLPRAKRRYHWSKLETSPWTPGNAKDILDRFSLRASARQARRSFSRRAPCWWAAARLGTVVANLLVRAGVGRLRIIDRDFVEPSNLQRQTLFEESDAREALPKSVAAERRLRAINSDVRVEGIVSDVTSGKCPRAALGLSADSRRHRQFRDPAVTERCSHLSSHSVDLCGGCGQLRRDHDHPAGPDRVPRLPARRRREERRARR